MHSCKFFIMFYLKKHQIIPQNHKQNDLNNNKGILFFLIHIL